ncbi:hypothetical protein B296_00018802 [Ensete ventricosum]|uniref:Uncharacterized protein n=1 Tax=Ensete ventricosum TaxID=4639 RepID=A0A427A846_ENSVE|nr:hypothetical protein B296_00018802 [Ensete ventricosum]
MMLFPSLVGPTAVFELGKKGTHLRDPSENPSIAASGSLGPLRFRSYEECRSLSSIPSCSLGATYDVALLQVEECGFHRRATINVLELSETPPLGPAAHLRKECHSSGGSPGALLTETSRLGRLLWRVGENLFFKQEMELSLIGLQNAGKTSLVNVIANFLSADIDVFAGIVGGIQYEEGDQGKRYHKIVGSWRPA